MIKWIKGKLGITMLEKQNQHLRQQIESHRKQVNAAVEWMKEFTRVDVDTGYRGDNTIILTGAFQGRGFVRFYDIGDGEFERMVYQLREMSRYAVVRAIDKPPEFRGSFDIFSEFT